jgi:predicted Zn-ribbon and HTH transcriptional regulator
MATHTCPGCKSNSFNWSIYEGDTPLTTWSCHKCGYVAFEAESLQRECPACHNKSEIRLVDTEKTYWWCRNCNSMTILTEG